MYYPVNENEGYSCPSRCCKLYSVALAILGAVILFAVGLVLGANFATTFFAATAVIVAAIVILAIVFLVTLLTRGCCNNNNG